MVTLAIRRSWRELRANAVRYGSMMLLVIVGLGIVVALSSASTSVAHSFTAAMNSTAVEDGSFDVYVPYSQDQLAGIEAQGVTVEEQSYRDVSGPDDSTLRVFENRTTIDKVVIDQGQLATADNEVVVEKLYAQAHNLSVGDDLDLDSTAYQISGIGSSVDYTFVLPTITDTYSNAATFGTVFVSPAAYARLVTGQPDTVFHYAYRLTGQISDDGLRRYLDGLDFDADQVTNPALLALVQAADADRSQLQDAVNLLANGAAAASPDNGQAIQTAQQTLLSFINDRTAFNLSNVISFVTQTSNPRIASVISDTQSNQRIAYTAGVLLLILIAYVLVSFASDTIERDSASIGALYAIGLRRKEIIPQYLLLPMFVVLFAGIIGTVLGLVFALPVNDFAQLTRNYSLPPLTTVISPVTLVYGLVVPPVIVALVDGYLLLRKLSRDPLQLLRKDYSNRSVPRRRTAALDSPQPRSFALGFRLRQLRMELRSYVVMFCGLFLSILLMVFGFGMSDSINRFVADVNHDVTFNHLYVLQFPPATPPTGGETAVVATFSLGSESQPNVTLLGVQPDSSFFPPVSTSSPDDVVISDAVALHYGIKQGDDFVLTDPTGDHSYRLHAESVVPYANGLYVFQPIAQTRTLLAEDSSYFNAVISNNALTFDPGVVATTIDRADITNTVSRITTLILPLVSILLVVSILVFCLVLLLLVRLVVDRDTYSISLLKSLGYHDREVSALYLGNYKYLVALACLVAIPASIIILQPLWFSLVAQMSMGTPWVLSWPSIIWICAIAAVAYTVVRLMSGAHLRRVPATEILKNRE